MMAGPEEKYKRQSGGEKEPLKTIHHNWVTSQSLQRVSDWKKRFLHKVFSYCKLSQGHVHVQVV